MNSRLFWAVGMCWVMAGCASSGRDRQKKEFYEDLPDGYYESESKPKETTLQRMIKGMGPRKSCLVLPFWNDTPFQDDTFGPLVAESLGEALEEKKKVKLAEDSAFQVTTRDFVDGDTVRVEQLIREGRRRGVATMVIGRISQVTFRHDREEVGVLRQARTLAAVEVEAKLFDVMGGREIHAVRRMGTAMDKNVIVFKDQQPTEESKRELIHEALRSAVQNMQAELAVAFDKMDWQGRVAKILGNKIFINAGKASGLITGDILRVLSAGEEIVDPVTRAFLGRSPGQMKGTLEVSEYVGADSAMTTIHSGGNFQEGDVVRLY